MIEDEDYDYNICAECGDKIDAFETVCTEFDSEGCFFEEGDAYERLYVTPA